MNTVTTTPPIKTHELYGPARSEVSCGICQTQTSRYTCPSCNLSYCSLNCFRSELHSRCSETFYRNEIEIGIKSRPSKAEGEKNKMLELLKRIDDQSIADEDELFHNLDEENEEDSFVSRFSAIDISSASADDLLRLLTKKERDKFFIALKDSSSRLAQELLESSEAKKTRQLPWWEAPSDSGSVPLQSPPLLPVPHGVRPGPMVVPSSLISQASRGTSLLYNICAVLLSYAYVTRHLSMSPLASTESDTQDQHEARRILSQTVPFLTDRKSKLCHMSLIDSVLSFWSRLNPGSVDDKAMLVLLEDVAKLVRPQRITIPGHSSKEQEGVVALATDHPFATVMMVISDLSSLFGAHVDSSAPASRTSHTVMKLTFYAAHILSAPSSRLHALADEINHLSKSIAKEAH